MLLAGCSARHGPPVAPVATCTTTLAVHVHDEAGAPVAGARVHSIAEARQCGPSGLPEACGQGLEESRVATTDARGIAHVCDLESTLFDRFRRGWIVVEHRDWPQAQVPLGRGGAITLGPARAARVEVPASCTDMRHVHVNAYTIEAGAVVAARRLDGMLRAKRYRLDKLGPWPYWVRSTDDRSGNSAVEAAACPSYVRVLDARRPSGVLLLDRSDALVDLPDFAGARATVRPFGSEQILVDVMLDSHGRATLPLPGTAGSAYCLRLETTERCETTYARAGEVATPELYADRPSEIEASCGRCD